MSEETLLKNSFFGGYKKREVIQYVDELLEENDRKVKQMEEQISFLVKENKRLQAKKQENETIIFPTLAPAKTIHQEEATMSIREQMKLPEGSYVLDKNQKIFTLPEPSPIYQTKRWETIEQSKQEDEIEDEIIDEIKEQEEKKEEHIKKKEYIKEVQKEPSSYVAVTEENIMPDRLCLQHEMELLKVELASVKKLLKEEKKEKNKLKAKLEYSNDLFMQLYKER